MSSDGDAESQAAVDPAGPTPLRRRWRRVMLIVAGILIVGLLLPAPMQIPVEGASARDWNPRSFWFEP